MDNGRIIRPVATKQTTDKNVVHWILKQNNFSDAVIFLIEQEVYSHGIRDLSKIIPSRRTKEYFCNNNNISKNNHTDYFKYFSSKLRKKK
ncbi:hypothetical protein [Vallitalea guaymasensis]|uniref:hypothetical protein n=1 Tax=Vallitalea guaymasensis TaxID=1185412 RepID=UPI000DE50067|nr:hypothetical protein [Vallitalea guaymasensis]